VTVQRGLASGAAKDGCHSSMMLPQGRRPTRTTPSLGAGKRLLATVASVPRHQRWAPDSRGAGLGTSEQRVSAEPVPSNTQVHPSSAAGRTADGEVPSPDFTTALPDHDGADATVTVLQKLLAAVDIAGSSEIAAADSEPIRLSHERCLP
jgi:hypothetical protein